jgi:hypothetical protein
MDRETRAPRPAGSTESDTSFCFGRLRLAGAGWSTLILAGSGVTSASADELWDVWSDLRTWPQWSPLHRSANWSGTAGFVRGAQLEQQLDLGFPFGVVTEQVTVDVCDPACEVAWCGDSGGIKSCHVWRFRPIGGNWTHVSNVEVLNGTGIGLIRPLVAARWRRCFQAAVDGVIETTDQARSRS